MSVGYNIVRSIGPALGGVILAFFGPLVAFALAALSDLVPLAAISRSKWRVRSSSLPRERIATAVHDGVRFTAMSSEIKAAIARGTLFGLASISILALLPLVVRDHLEGGLIVYGALLAAFGMGAFTAGLSSGYLRRLVTQDRLIGFAAIGCAVCCLSLSFTSALPIAAVALALGGAGWLLTWTGLDVCIQLASPRWVAGRTLSVYYAFSYGGMAAGSWIWGAVAQNYSLTLALEGAAGALLLAAAAARVQSRAGARNWTLQRNLQTPNLWTETFRTPTWMDYLRLNHRLTAWTKSWLNDFSLYTTASILHTRRLRSSGRQLNLERRDAPSLLCLVAD